MNPTIKFQPEYNAVKCFYGERCAQRSGVPLINHIHEGLEILGYIGASMDAQRAYCMHPLMQDDKTLGAFISDDVLYSFSPRVVMLAMEYRQRANAWLSDKVIVRSRFAGTADPVGRPDWGCLNEVCDMLIADKIQNYKDFVLYHKDTHERSLELDIYFMAWFEELGINPDRDEDPYAIPYLQIVEHLNKGGWNV